MKRLIVIAFLVLAPLVARAQLLVGWQIPPGQIAAYDSSRHLVFLGATNTAHFTNYCC